MHALRDSIGSWILFRLHMPSQICSTNCDSQTCHQNQIKHGIVWRGIDRAIPTQRNHFALLGKVGMIFTVLFQLPLWLVCPYLESHACFSGTIHSVSCSAESVGAFLPCVFLFFPASNSGLASFCDGNKVLHITICNFCAVVLLVAFE